jgi:flavin-dependent dehydrogenase
MICADAVVIGAGPAGCAAALGLARAGGRVVLYDRKPVCGRKPGEIVEPTVRIALAELGLVAAFDALNSLMLAGNLSLWDSDEVVEFDGMISPYGYGALIDRPRFEGWLLSAARQAGVTVLPAGPRLAAEAKGVTWHLTGRADASSPSVTTPVIIEATGRGNGIVGRSRREWTDRLVALLIYAPMPPGPRDQRLLIEASEHGWWYAAPLPCNMAVIAFMTDADLLPLTAESRAAYVRRQLGTTRLIRAFAAHTLQTPRIVGFPANSSIRQLIDGPGWVSIGDAAATYDPLSGRGVAIALSKGVAIARLISNSDSLSRALAAYADTERAVFADYLYDQRKTYRRAARQFRSAFWERRCA